nr:MAG TPA: hypothetical protein [Bacteriophage sp.]
MSLSASIYNLSNVSENLLLARLKIIKVYLIWVGL